MRQTKANARQQSLQIRDTSVCTICSAGSASSAEALIQEKEKKVAEMLRSAHNVREQRSNGACCTKR